MSLSAAQQRWVAAGLASITGDPTGRCLVPPTGIVERMEGLGGFGVDVLPLLGERAVLLGLTRRGQISCGGATRLLEASDGWIALALPRPDDVELLPAWLGVEGDGGDVGLEHRWPRVAEVIQTRKVAGLVEAGQQLGLPVGSPSMVAGKFDRRGVRQGSPRGRVVVDLSSLWAGPLCSRLLRDDGAEVIKVESIGRPDGGRPEGGPPGSQTFFDLLHAGKRSVALDFTDEEDRCRLAGLLSRADVVIEGSRPRALRQLGIVAEELMVDGPGIWVSITGHGRDPAHELAVGFGDDAAVAGGLVAWPSDGAPRFAADAIADPLTGIAAHRAVLDALAAGGRGLIDVSLSGVAAWVSGSDRGVSWTELDPAGVPRPASPTPGGSAPSLGRDTGAVLQALGIS